MKSDRTADVSERTATQNLSSLPTEVGTSKGPNTNQPKSLALFVLLPSLANGGKRPAMDSVSSSSSGALMVIENICNSPRYSKSIYVSSSKCFRSRSIRINSIHMEASSFKSRICPYHCFPRVDLPFYNRSRRLRWLIYSNIDDRKSDSSLGGSDSGTRLVRAIILFRIRLVARIKELRKGLPMKVLFFLVGFYSATAFSTVIGQTGDWDILSAGLAVVVVEAIGAVMYSSTFAMLFNRVKSVITMFNYWKAGISLGLFLDAFKYEDDMFLWSCNPFNIGIDWFNLCW